jgi:two-component system phosphate regulon sensor histidine kinase PhoR
MFRQLFVAYAALLLAAIAILGLVIAGRVRALYHHQINERLRAVAVGVKDLARDWPADKIPSLHKRMEPWSRDFAAHITLVAADGHVVADSDETTIRSENAAHTPEIQEARDRGYGSATRPSETLGKMMKYYALRVQSVENSISYVRVGVPLEEIEEQIAGLSKVVWTGAAATAAAAMILTFWLARRITSPLQELTRSAKRIAKGDFGHKVYTVGQGEVANLARSFNHMSEQLALQFSQLEEDRQQLRTILSSMVEGVIALDSEERIVFANDRAGQLLDFRAPTVVGRRLWEVARHPALQDLVKRALIGPADCDGEVNSEGPVARSLTVQAARLPGTPVRGVVLVLHDTSEIRRLERLRQEFVANVSHELKTPLSVIKACIETLLDGAADDAEHRGPFLEQIASQADRLHALILDLLSLASIESSSEVYEYQPVALEPLVTRCLQRHRARAESRNQILETTPPSAGSPGTPAESAAEPVLAWADEEAVSQILDNLVDNALKYTPPGGRVCVRWGARNGQVHLEVEDTGIGIPENDLPHIFERFYRVDKARSRAMGGTGLGLSIVKHLTQALNGSVSAVSRIGEGSTFTISLPRAAPD